MPNPNPSWLLLLIPLVVLLAWTMFRIRRRLTASQVRLLVMLLAAYVIAEMIRRVAWFGWQTFSPVIFARAADYLIGLSLQAMAMIGSILLLRFWKPDVFVAQSPTVDSVVNVRDQLPLILRSSDFLTALNESLPRGAGDEEHGLDYIPYLLQAVRARRQRFESSARRFLWITFFVGGVSAIIIGLFGWILLDESLVGAPRELHAARAALQAIASAARGIATNYKDTAEFHELRLAVYANAGARTSPLQRQLQEMTERAVAPEDLLILLQRLNTSLQSLVPLDENDRTFLERLGNAARNLERWQQRQRELADSITQNNARLAQILPPMELAVSKDSVRLAELLRRLAIGLIIATFFLALVRFSGTLYRADYLEVLRADLDDLLVRAFYVTYKAADSNSDQRAAVLAGLLSTVASARSSAGVGESARTTGGELDVLKELISAAAKKL